MKMISNFDAYGKIFSGTSNVCFWLIELHVFIFVRKSFSFADVFVSCVTVVGVFMLLILSFPVSILMYRWFTLDRYGEHRLRFKFPSSLISYCSSITVSIIRMTEVDVLGINGILSVIGAQDDDGCS